MIGRTIQCAGMCNMLAAVWWWVVCRCVDFVYSVICIIIWQNCTAVSEDSRHHLEKKKAKERKNPQFSFIFSSHGNSPVHRGAKT